MKTTIRCTDCNKDITTEVKYYWKGKVRCEKHNQECE